MKNLLALIVVVTASIISHAQTEQKFNFGFEKQSHSGGLSDGWHQWGDYVLSIDTVCRTGQKSGKITSVKEGQFGSIAYKIPANYSSKKIVLEGYMKIRNVENGFAGIMLRVDGNGKLLAFDNMQNKRITGTRDWQKYTITLTYPDKAEDIYIAGILTGTGEAWFDDFVLYIDGKNIQELKTTEKPAFKASLDKEFINGSGITSIPTDETRIDDLKTLGLIWGFIKYYHPVIAKGEYNWDYELFRILPNVLNAADRASRDEILMKWIESLGQVAQGKELTMASSDVKILPDLDWISNSGFSDELVALLLKIKSADRPKEHYYIGLKPHVGNPDFINENAYASMKYPDTGYRLLALYRYWNVIQYYFPYKNLIEEDWKNVLAEFIPKFIDAKNETEYTLAVLEIIGRINDTHANIWGGNPILNNYFGNRYASVELTFVENKAVVTGFYNEQYGMETGLIPGDIISSVNKTPVDEIVKDVLKYHPASNYPTQLRDIASDLLRTNDSVIHIEFIRNDKTETKTIKTYTTKEINLYGKYNNSDTCFKMITKDIAYINNGSCKKKYLPRIWKEIEQSKGLIIDNRNYPSDFIIYDLSYYLMTNRPFVKFTNGSIESPGLFTFTQTLKAGRRNKKHYYKGKVVILVNETSQSSSEFHAMAYRAHPNATVIGSTTAGADGNVSQCYLPGGISTMISGIGVYYPDGKETQRIGIVPDIEIKPTIQGIKQGRDEVLEKAIEVINGK